MNKDNLIGQAHLLLESGMLDDAAVLFEKVLSHEPQNFVTLYSLGVIKFKKRELCSALSCFDKAKKINSCFAPLYYNIGLTNYHSGNLAEAVTNLKRAVEIDPTFDNARIQLQNIEAMHSITVVGGEQGNKHTDALCRAVELQSLNRLDEAKDILDQLLKSNPLDFCALYTSGVIEQQAGRPDRAFAYFVKALEIQPQYAPLWYNQGVVLHELRQHEQSVASYEKALKINPHYVEAMINLGAVQAEMKRQKDALLIYEEIIKIEPGNPVALCNRGILLCEFKMYDLAVQTFAVLLKIAPDYDYALGLYVHAKLSACDWENLDPLVLQIENSARSEKRVCKPQGILAISGDPAVHQLCSRIYANQMHPAKEPLWQGVTYHHKRIRIAYISPDFREHPVGYLTAGLFEQHDRTRFEITAISLGIDDRSPIRQRMLDAFDNFTDARNMTAKEIAVMLRGMEIDIAVDLAGFTADSRTDIFAWRPAPIQINYLGYSSTMGTGYYDYIIADQHVIPEKIRHCYNEKVIYLPDTYLPTDSRVAISKETPLRDKCGLPAKGIVFCSFNHDYKINPATFDIWMRLLLQVPGSVLWLMKLHDIAESNLRKEAALRGVDPDRLVFATRVPLVEDHLARYRLADLFLDTAPYNAHTTASDALRAGLPVLTCCGKSFAGRVAAGLLHVVGLPELITDSLEEYEKLALRLALDSDLLGSIRSRLLQNLETTSLYDTAHYCRNLEAAYTAVWERYKQNRMPEHLDFTAPISSAERRSADMTADEIRQKIDAQAFWYHKIKLPHGIVTPGWAPLDVELYAISDDLTGKRVLDVGAWDGFWTFEALKRGASQVVAIDDFSDYLGKLPPDSRKAWQTFDLCREILGYDDYRCQRYDMSLYNLNIEKFGRFDIVFFFGTLYHLRHPMLALDLLSSVCSDEIYVESAILDDFSPYLGGFNHGYPGNQMVMEFYPGREYGDNNTNWWCPTLACLQAMVQSAGFIHTRAWKIESPQILSHCRGFVYGTKKGPSKIKNITAVKENRTEAADVTALSRIANAIRQIQSDLAFTILEIGALPIAGKERFHELCSLFPGSRIIAFELEEQLCKELNTNAPDGICYYPVALGKSEEQRSLYLTEHPMCSSLYQPNEELLTRYQQLDVAMLKDVRSVKTESLDNFLIKQGIIDVDFIKIDIQGAELDVFQGGLHTLENVVAIVSEVEFIPLYIKQPLFGDVSAFLTEHGFMFHKFLGVCSRTVKPAISNNPFSGSQQMWSDAVFVRDILLLKKLSDDKILKTAIISFMYGSPDLATHCLEIYDERHGTELKLFASD